MALATTISSKDEFVNTSSGWIGAVQVDHNGRAMGVSVEPGGSIFLSEEEQILTANAPRMDEDNPFINGALELRTRAVEIRNRRPFGAQAAEAKAAPAEAEETGATPAPEAAPPQGSAAPGEEVATPEAAAPEIVAPGTRRRKG